MTFQRVSGKQNALPTPMQTEQRPVEVQAGGTSEGVKKGWDTRGRGKTRWNQAKRKRLAQKRSKQHSAFVDKRKKEIALKRKHTLLKKRGIPEHAWDNY